jgi:hypothetical protein
VVEGGDAEFEERRWNIEGEVAYSLGDLVIRGGCLAWAAWSLDIDMRVDWIWFQYYEEVRRWLDQSDAPPFQILEDSELFVQIHSRLQLKHTDPFGKNTIFLPLNSHCKYRATIMSDRHQQERPWIVSFEPYQCRVLTVFQTRPARVVEEEAARIIVFISRKASSCDIRCVEMNFYNIIQSLLEFVVTYLTEQYARIKGIASLTSELYALYHGLTV